jgi:hypothetical protein
MADEIHPELRTFVDRVVVQELFDRFLRGDALPPLAEPKPQRPNRQSVADWIRVRGTWVIRTGPNST